MRNLDIIKKEENVWLSFHEKHGLSVSQSEHRCGLSVGGREGWSCSLMEPSTDLVLLVCDGPWQHCERELGPPVPHSPCLQRVGLGAGPAPGGSARPLCQCPPVRGDEPHAQGSCRSRRSLKKTNPLHAAGHGPPGCCLMWDEVPDPTRGTGWYPFPPGSTH